MVYKYIKENNISYFEAEKSVLNTTHQEIGNLLIDKWSLPKSLSTTILNHHKPSECLDNRELVSIVHLADYCTQLFGMGALSWDENYSFDESVLDILGFASMEKFDSFLEKYKNNYRNYLETSY